MFLIAVRISGVIHGFFATLYCFRLNSFLEKIDWSNHLKWLKEYLRHNCLTFLMYLVFYKGQLKTFPYVLQKIVERKGA